MMSVESNCSICLQSSPQPTVRRPRSRPPRRHTAAATVQDTVWAEHCAVSVCKLLDLPRDPFCAFFVSNYQCANCTQLFRDVDFLSRRVEALNDQLSVHRVKLAKFLCSTIESSVDINGHVTTGSVLTPAVAEPEVQLGHNVTSGPLTPQNYRIGGDVTTAIKAPSPMSSISEASEGIWLSADIKIEPITDSCRPLVPTTNQREVSISTANENTPSSEIVDDIAVDTDSVVLGRPVRSCRLSHQAVSYRDDVDESEEDTGKRKGFDADTEGRKRCRRNSDTESDSVRDFSNEFESDSNDSAEPIIPNLNANSESIRNPESTPNSESIKNLKSIKKSNSESIVNPYRISNPESISEPKHTAARQSKTITARSIKKFRKKRRIIFENPFNESPLPLSNILDPIIKVKGQLKPKISSKPAPFFPPGISRADYNLLLKTMRFLVQLEREDVLEVEKNYSYFCTSCDRRYVDLKSLQTHKTKVHSEDTTPLAPFQCPFCDWRTFGDYLLDAHIVRVHGGDRHPYICPLEHCPHKFRNRDHFLRHMHAKHPEEHANLVKGPLYDHRLTYRDKSVVGTPGAKFRKRVGEGPGATRVQVYCPFEGCSRRCSSQFLLDVHYAKEHVQDPLPYKCTVLNCSRAYKEMSCFRTHVQLAHGFAGKGTVLTCLFCPHRCLGQSNMNAHMRARHSKLDVPKFWCRVCNLLYFVHDACTEHENLHTEEKGSACVVRYCTAMEHASVEELRAHVDLAHSETCKSRYVCDTCGHSTQTKSQLGVHMRIHENKFLYNCTFCTKGFKRKSNLESHEQILHGDKVEKRIYPCTSCDQTFTVKQYLYKHRFEKHREQTSTQ